MTRLAQLVGWYIHWTDRLGAAALRNFLGDDLDDDFDEIRDVFPDAKRAD